MRKLAVLTTTAAIALFGAASAQNATAPAPRAPAPQGPAATAQGSTVQTSIHAYAAYHSDIGDLRAARVGNANELERALDIAARHNRDALSRGWIAYGAMTAAQSPAFVAGVREAAAHYGRDAVIRGMSVDPGWARLLRGGDEATRIVLNSATADAARIIAVADRYRELAYGLQRQGWANAVAPQQAARVQRIRGLSAGALSVPPGDLAARFNVMPVTLTPQTDPTVFGGRRFWDSVRGNGGVTEAASAAPGSWRVKPERGEAVNRMTTIAALQALGAAESNPTLIDRLLNESRSRDCLEMAQLQLFQCMSAARFRYENAFCMGQHALRDVGLCISGIAQPAPAPGQAPLAAAQTPALASQAISRPNH